MAFLLFDLDDTLVVEDAAAKAAYLATAATVPGVDAAALAAAARLRARELWRRAPVHPYCLRVGISSSEAMWCRFEGDGNETAWLREWAPAYRREAWSAALADQGIDDPVLAEALGERFGVERRARHEVFDDAAPALEELGGRHTLGLLTNGDSSLQREKIAASGLAGHFAAIVISGDFGAGKPETGIFRHALERLGGRAAEAWMIGDSVERDVEGALAAGLRAVWTNRAGSDGGHRPQVTTLAELPALLG